MLAYKSNFMDFTRKIFVNLSPVHIDGDDLTILKFVKNFGMILDPKLR